MGITKEYRLSIQGRHLPVTEAMKAHIQTRLSRLERVTDQILDIHVIVEKQKVAHRAEIVLLFGHFKVVGHAVCDDLYAAIDKAADRIHAQLVRYKDRIHAHQAKEVRAISEMPVDVWERSELEAINEEIESETKRLEAERYKIPKIVRKDTMVLKTLTTEEAMMKLDLSGESFMVFRSEEDQKIRVIYETNDGNFGIVTPE